MRYTVLSVKVIIAWAVLIVAVGGAVTAWLLMGHTDRDTEADRLKLDAIRTAGSIVVGTGGAAALLLAARRQRSTEIALRQKDRDQADTALAFALRERVAADTRDDAAARRITDLYTKAVELLGSPHAPVRLGGLYALERLAQDNPGQRQTIVNVLCACLRMPCELPDDTSDDLPVEQIEDTYRATYRERLQEREVRLTAQRLITAHLCPGEHTDGPLSTFWRDIDLDLTAATLVGFSLRRCAVRTAVFRSATFVGYADFASAAFSGDADFGATTFTGGANFGATRFAADADFEWTTFTEYANFEAATFATADFEWSTFGDGADFESAQFTHSANFGSTTFTDGADFERTHFHDGANFGAAGFTGYADFRTTVFGGTTNFGAATFTANADFHGAEFCPIPAPRTDSPTDPQVDFHSTTFERGIPPELADYTDLD
ncbi:hypothetical protein CLV40_11532 [Actinokineospora auranticolor]|uniref:Pentapeptide repeat protein n=1 Tax=Actinokineospora auranticolor TaxID=155976 RepID=A0A2S6GIZ0_9PSEU|nr:hypothetical protein CLV40_11532 [Actinokineospora auranticolor]